jgi:hypothetical protein
MNATRSPRGVIIKLLGAIMMMLGLLDCVLTLRGGVPAYEFLLLVFFGAGVFAIGVVRAGNSYGGSASPENAQLRAEAGVDEGSGVRQTNT